jgi:hypothetical protein
VLLVPLDHLAKGQRRSVQTARHMQRFAGDVGSIIRREESLGIAEFIIGPAEGRARWLNPSYGLSLRRSRPRADKRK